MVLGLRVLLGLDKAFYPLRINKLYNNIFNISTFSGNQIGRYADRYQEFPDGSLLLSEVRATDEGNYSCSVSNAYGRDVIYYMVTVRGW